MAEDSQKSNPGAVLFAILFLVAGALLLSQLGEQTKFSSKTWMTKKMFAQPAFWPAVGVIGMVFFGALHLIVEVLRRQRGGSFAEASVWLRSLEYLGWFMAYVFVVPVIGYLLASIVFMVLLTFRAGYRGWPRLGAAGLTGLAIVLIFKAGLSVKIPGGAIYEHLPDSVRSFAMINL